MRFHLHRFSCAFLLSLWVGGGAMASDSLHEAVRVGTAKVPTHEVMAAVRECTTHAPRTKASNCISSFFVPRWLMDAHASEIGLAASPQFHHQRNDLLFRSLQQHIEGEFARPSKSEVRQYLETHSRDFQKPARFRIFRILLSTKEEARKVLRDLGTNVNIETFRKAARDSSVDTATNERGGDLGFVWPDGTTDVPQVQADPELYSVAKKLTDGEIAQLPIPEGERFAVLWRRGSLAAVELNDDSRRIATLRVQEKKTEAALQSLLRRLGEKHVKKRQNILLGKLRRKKATLFQ